MKIFDWIIKDNESPNKKFHYAFREPESLNPAAFGAHIAFFDNNENLLYYNKNGFAHELNDPAIIAKEQAVFEGQLLPRATNETNGKLRLATWSKQGNMAHILEYNMFEHTYHHVFMNLAERYQIRALYAISGVQEFISIDAVQLTRLGIFRPNFDEYYLIEVLNNLRLNNPEPLLKDKRYSTVLYEFLNLPKWYR